MIHAAAPGDATRASTAGRLAFWIGLAVLVVAALVARLPAFGPPSLWLDDEWVAVLVARAPLELVLFGRIPCSPGFVLFERAIATLLGSGARQLQLLPAVAGLAQVVLVGLVALRLTGSRALALIAAALLAANPTIATFSLRVKQFSVDGVVTLVLLLLALHALRSPRLRAFALLAIISTLLLPLSFASLFLAVALVNVEGARRFLAREPGDMRQRRGVVAIWAGFDGAVAAIYFALMRGRANPSLFQHWHEYFLPLDDARAAWTYLSERGVLFFTGALPPGLGVLALLVPIGVACLLWRRSERSLGVALSLFYAGTFIASAGLYPFGTGRLDMFAYPVSILAVVAAGSWATSASSGERMRWALSAIAGMTVIASAWVMVRTPVEYPQSDGRETVERLNAVLADGDGLVVYPWSNSALGAHGRWPVHLVEVTDSTNGFYVHLERPSTLVLHESLNGIGFQDDPAVVREQLGPFLASAPRRLFYMAIEGPAAPHEWIRQAIETSGHELIGAERHGRAAILLYERPTLSVQVPQNVR